MVAMGRGLMSQPKILLIDEPSLGLAPVIVNEVFEIIARLKEAGTTILLVEQNTRVALSWPTTCISCAAGRCGSAPPPARSTSTACTTSTSPGDLERMSEPETLRIAELCEGVRLLTLDRPARRNALDRATYAALREAIRAAGDDDARARRRAHRGGRLLHRRQRPRRFPRHRRNRRGQPRLALLKVLAPARSRSSRRWRATRSASARRCSCTATSPMRGSARFPPALRNLGSARRGRRATSCPWSRAPSAPPNS